MSLSTLKQQNQQKAAFLFNHFVLFHYHHTFRRVSVQHFRLQFTGLGMTNICFKFVNLDFLNFFSHNYDDYAKVYNVLALPRQKYKPHPITFTVRHWEVRYC